LSVLMVGSSERGVRKARSGSGGCVKSIAPANFAPAATERQVRL